MFSFCTCLLLQLSLYLKFNLSTAFILEIDIYRDGENCALIAILIKYDN